MPILIKAGETTAANKRVYFQCVDATDGLTPETGETGGQPQISTNGAAFTDTGIGVLVALGNGRYYGELTDGAVDTAGRIIEARYKSANTAEAVGTTVQVVAFNPHAIAGLGLTNLDATISSRGTADPGDAMLITAGTGAGQLDVTSGVIKANLAQILGTALTETGGYLAAGFKKLFNVATPVLTAESVNQTGDSFVRIGAAGASLTALGDTRLANLDATVGSRSTYAGADTAGTTTLLSRATELRLSELDAANLPADVDAIRAKTDALPATPATSTLTAQQVWEYGARSLTTFGTLVTSIWEHASAVAIKIVTDKLATMLEAAGAAWRWTAAALVNAPGGGSGEFPVALTVEDDSGDPVPAARLTIPGLSVQSTQADGTFASAWALDAGTYEVTILTGAGYAPSNPYTLVVAADGSVTTPTGGAFVVTKATTPEPTPAGYCTVWCLAGTEGPGATTGTFYVSEVFSPEVYDPDGTPVEIVRGGTSMALVDGAAYRQVRQGAVVSFVLATPGKQKDWPRVVVPETDEAYVQNLVAEE